MRPEVLIIKGDRLRIRCDEPSIREDRSITQGDLDAFAEWGGRYARLIERDDGADGLLEHFLV